MDGYTAFVKETNLRECSGGEAWLNAALQEDATQLLSQRDESRSIPSCTNPVANPDASLLQTAPSDIVPTFADIYSPSQPALASPPDLDTPDTTRSVETSQPSWPTVDSQKRRPSINRRYKALIAFLCLMLLLGGTIWLIMAQQQVARTTTTTKIFHAPLATAAAKAYQAGETNNGVQFGFDAAHTRSNPYERVLNTTNVTDIKQLWSFPTEAKIFSSPVVANGMVYVGSYDHKLYTFDAACRHNCQPLWSFTTGDQINSSPAVANGIVYISSNDYKLYAFDATCRSNCQPLWSFNTGNFILSSPAAANGAVYVGSGGGNLYAFDATCRRSCQPLWSFTTGTGSYINSSPAVANSVVYIGSANGKLYAFDATCRHNCLPLWSFTTGSSIESSPIRSQRSDLYWF
jgi:outer membrane protein assembly factor BamB